MFSFIFCRIFTMSTRLFPCDSCDMSYDTQVQLDRHFDDRHGPKVFCTECGQVFPQKRTDNQRRHLSRAHNMDCGSKAANNLIPVGRFFRPVYIPCPTPRQEGIKSTVFRPKPVLDNLYVPLPTITYKKKSSTPLKMPAMKKHMPDRPVSQQISVPSMPVLSAGLPVGTDDKENAIKTPTLPLPDSPVLPDELEELFKFNCPSPITAPAYSPLSEKKSPVRSDPDVPQFPPKKIKSDDRKPNFDPRLLFNEAPSSFLDDSMSKMAQIQNKEAKAVSDPHVSFYQQGWSVTRKETATLSGGRLYTLTTTLSLASPCKISRSTDTNTEEITCPNCNKNFIP